MGDKRKGFLVFFDIADGLAAFSDEEVGRIFRAMIAYAANGEELPLPDREAIAFGFIKSQIERDGERYAEICAKRKAAIEARWERENTKDTNEYKSIQPIQENTNDTKTKTDTKTDTKTKTDLFIPPLPPTGERAPAKRFEPPTVEEVAAYCKERKNGVDAQLFIDYYTANGWKVGRNAMKDWKAAVRTWERNGYGSGAPAQERKEAVPTTASKYAPPAGTKAAVSFNRMLDRARQYEAELEAET